MTKRLITGLLLIFLVFSGFKAPVVNAVSSNLHSYNAGPSIPQHIVNRLLYIACNTWSLTYHDVCQKHKVGAIEFTEVNPDKTYKIRYYLPGGGILEVLEDLE